MKTHSIKKKLGQNTVEYVILAVLLAVGTIGAFKFLGGAVKTQVQNVSSAISGEGTAAKAGIDDATSMSLETTAFDAIRTETN